MLRTAVAWIDLTLTPAYAWEGTMGAQALSEYLADVRQDGHIVEDCDGYARVVFDRRPDGRALRWVELHPAS